jgi:hypothetical protein
MKIKSTLAGIIVASSMAAFVIPTQAWSMGHKHCTGTGWHMVSKSCDIRPAMTWQEYDSGVYTQPLVGMGYASSMR